MSDPEPARAEPGEPYGIVAIAASAGGITALGRVLGGLPTDSRFQW
jgi:chemotaxis response regulator CheB